jgi:hypothetical protein
MGMGTGLQRSAWECPEIRQEKMAVSTKTVLVIVIYSDHDVAYSNE